MKQDTIEVGESVFMRKGPGEQVTEMRELGFVETISHQFGRVQERVGCPFCQAEVVCYRWSRFGSGKRCPGCGAILSGYGATRKVDAWPGQIGT